MRLRSFFMPVLAVALTTAVFLAATFAARRVSLPPGSFFPSSFVTHSLMLVLSAAAMLLISKGRLDRFGFTGGTYRFSLRILWWVLPVLVLSLAGALASRGRHGADSAFGLTRIQTIVFVWFYATLCEETLVRGLLQTLLSGSAKAGASVGHWLRMPVLVSGLFFGAMHLPLVQQMGPKMIPVVLMATYLGLVAAHYRQKTGSLLPALLVHLLFNIAGVLPLWAVQCLRGSL
jgi:membrane protease YdiL (CAAX protease family)